MSSLTRPIASRPSARWLIEAISGGSLAVSERKILIGAYRDSINGYTYYE